MNPFRIVILGLLAWLVYRVLRSWSADGPGTPKRPRTPDQFEMMARCLKCGVFVPRDSLSERGRCRNCEKSS
jgi:hypothetical protein